MRKLGLLIFLPFLMGMTFDDGMTVQRLLSEIKDAQATIEKHRQDVITITNEQNEKLQAIADKQAEIDSKQAQISSMIEADGSIY